jgi:UDP-N-acetylmuramoylalanine--D-glutamate ligase
MTMKKKLSVLGSGISGVGSALLGIKQSWSVFVSDSGTISPVNKHIFTTNGIEFEEGQHHLETLLKSDLIVKSPGIPRYHPVVKQLLEAGIPVISELDWASRFTQSKLIGITGTNGKTTATLLCYHLLKNAGLSVGCVGNVGISFAQMVAEDPKEVYVIEVSSFQLDDTFSTRFHISCILNISEDHLDRYQGQFSRYIDSKLSITKNQTPEDYFLYNCDDQNISIALQNKPINVKPISFGFKKNEHSVAHTHEDILNIFFNNHNLNIPMNNLNLRGKHNQYNSMAAAVMAQILEVRNDQIRESMSSFQNMEHRLETVAKFKGVEYINDSKATNVNSTWYALESMEKPVIWIAGGVDKGNDYKDLKPLVKEKVKLIICLGLDNIKLHQAFQGDVDMIINTSSATEAVHVASRMAAFGDAVLLSPACASFDLFENYEDRGRKFKQAVRSL